MAVYEITTESLYRMHRLKKEMKEKKKGKLWVRVAVVVFVAAWLLIGR